MKRFILILVGFLAVVGCQPDPEDAHLFFSGVPYPEILPEADQGFSFDLVTEYGNLNEGLVFGKIAGLAVSEAGILAVLDEQGCRIWMIDTKTDDYWDFGGCGDGPAEFREATAAVFRADTLLVWDGGRASIARMSLTGEELDRFRLSPMELDAVWMSDLYVSQGGSVLTGLDLLPNSVTSEHRQYVSFDSLGGSITGRTLTSPPVARNTPREVVRPSSFCVGRVKGRGEVVVAVNPWGPQVALLRLGDYKPLVSGRIPIEWAQTSELRARPGYWGPLSPTPRAACGERYAVIEYRRHLRVSREVSEVVSAAMVTIDLWEPSITILGEEVPPQPGSILLLTPGAAYGNRYFFFTNSFLGYPVVREYRLVPTESMG